MVATCKPSPNAATHRAYASAPSKGQQQHTEFGIEHTCNAGSPPVIRTTELACDKRVLRLIMRPTSADPGCLNTLEGGMSSMSGQVRAGRTTSCTEDTMRRRGPGPNRALHTGCASNRRQLSSHLDQTRRTAYKTRTAEGHMSKGTTGGRVQQLCLSIRS